MRHLVIPVAALLAAAPIGRSLAPLPRPFTPVADTTGRMPMGAHLLMTVPARQRPGDAERADSILAVARSVAARYASPADAERDGFRLFAPRVRHQRIFHYANRRNALLNRWGFDPARPSAILYTRDADGAWHLEGVMYTAPASATDAELDARVPLSVATWHLHTNLCLPPRSGDGVREADVAGPAARFGPRGTIATREGCDAAGGRFVPQAFGWMVHVNTAERDPAMIWGEHHDMH